MNTAVKKIGRWVICAFLGFYSINSNAGHLLGTDITYTYVSPGVYQVSVRWYRDCQGLPAVPQISVCISSVSCATSGTFSLDSAGSIILPPSSYLPPVTSSCQGGPGLGIEKTTYSGLVTLPSTCSDWIISYSSFPQNAGQNQSFLYVSTKIDNLNYPVNSSSAYVADPTFVFCTNQQAWNNFGSTDADGDSLFYHLNPYYDNTTPCPPAPFLNPMQPFNQLQSSTPIVIDSLNGVMTFTPSTVQQAFISARVDEFRNGVLINSSTIEHLSYIISNCIVSGISENDNSKFKIHPNPAKESLFVEIAGYEKPLYAEATDMSGKNSLLEIKYSREGVYEIDISSLSKGSYALKIISTNEIAVKRFVKL